MRRLLLTLIDIGAAFCALFAVGPAYGYGWGTLAGLSVLFYGLICYMDGHGS